MNFCEDFVIKFKELILLYDLEDCYGLNCLFKWRKVMIFDGFLVWVINDWCVVFLMMLLEDLILCDVDVIVDFSFCFL